jgi:hypothetical protein
MLNLYPAERTRMPMSEVIELMRRDLQIELPPNGPAKISFAYPDREKARQVCREMVSKFMEENHAINRMRGDIWRQVWQRNPPAGETAEVLVPPNLPDGPEISHRLGFLAWGLGTGGVLGLFTACLARRPRHGFRVLTSATAGSALAFAASFLIPATYRSYAVMRVTESWSADHYSGHEASTSLPAVLARIEPEVLSAPRLQSARRQDIRIVAGAGRTFIIGYTDSDPKRAMATVREMVSLFMERYNHYLRTAEAGHEELQRISEYKAGENLEVLDPAGDPQPPISPNRAAWSAIGLAMGLAAGLTRAYFGARIAPQTT